MGHTFTRPRTRRAVASASLTDAGVWSASIPWCLFGQHPSQLTSTPVSELPLHSHSSFVGGHCLQMFPGIECLGNTAIEGLPQNTVMLDTLAPWFNSRVCLESRELTIPCLWPPHIVGDQPIKMLSLSWAAEHCAKDDVKNQPWFSQLQWSMEMSFFTEKINQSILGYRCTWYWIFIRLRKEERLGIQFWFHSMASGQIVPL